MLFTAQETKSARKGFKKVEQTASGGGGGGGRGREANHSIALSSRLRASQQMDGQTDREDSNDWEGGWSRTSLSPRILPSWP